jgi:hypothetical protein
VVNKAAEALVKKAKEQKKIKRKQKEKEQKKQKKQKQKLHIGKETSDRQQEGVVISPTTSRHVIKKHKMANYQTYQIVDDVNKFKARKLNRSSGRSQRTELEGAA